MFSYVCKIHSQRLLNNCNFSRSPLFANPTRFRTRQTNRYHAKNPPTAANKSNTPSAFVFKPKPRSTTIRSVARCGLFAFASINSLLYGSAFLNGNTGAIDHSYPPSSKSPKWGRGEAEGSQSGRLGKIRLKIESILGRPLKTEDVYWAIVGCNLIVYLFNISPKGMAVLRYSTNTPYGPTPALSMLLSVFSHYSFAHLAINMYVLHSFFEPLTYMIGPTDFTALYLGGGIFSSFISVLQKSLIRCPLPSLGASGSICAVLAATCHLQPTAQLCVPFVNDVYPHSFPAGTAIWCLLAFEFLGAFMLVGRSPIDHAAHLGGLLFGLIFTIDQGKAIEQRRVNVHKWWRSLNGGGSSS